MSVFVDTSALLSVIDADDAFHRRAKSQWETLLDDGTALVTTNYTILESVALLQRRIGMEAVGTLVHEIEPVLEVVWVGSQTHRLATEALVAGNRRQISLVDMTSFLVMREKRIDQAFAFDAHFAEQGFELLPAQ